MKCPECNKKLTFLYQLETEYRGLLIYYKCKDCREEFVLANQCLYYSA